MDKVTIGEWIETQNKLKAVASEMEFGDLTRELARVAQEVGGREYLGVLQAQDLIANYFTIRASNEQMLEAILHFKNRLEKSEG